MAPRPEWLNPALAHQRAGRFAEAERICGAILGASPAEADALHLLGLIAASRDQYELAGTMFARAITFKPNRVEGAVNMAGDSQVQLHGYFGIHGAEHELTLPAKVSISNSRASAIISFLVPYINWGMKDPSTLFLKVKNTVEIEVRATGRLGLP